LGDSVARYIQDKMVNELNLVETLIPQKSKNQVNIFHTSDFLTNKNTVMVLVLGSGKVLAGNN
jgi:hypothetical protein